MSKKLAIPIPKSPENTIRILEFRNLMGIPTNFTKNPAGSHQTWLVKRLGILLAPESRECPENLAISASHWPSLAGMPVEEDAREDAGGRNRSNGPTRRSEEEKKEQQQQQQQQKEPSRTSGEFLISVKDERPPQGGIS